MNLRILRVRGRSLFYVSLLFLIILCVGCSRAIGEIGDRENAKALSRTISKMIAESGSSNSLDRCQMYPGTRAGFCISKVDLASINKISSHFELKQENRDRFHDARSCLHLETFGISKDDGSEGFNLRAGTILMVPQKPLFPSSENVRFKALYFNKEASSSCFEFEFPYG